MKKIKHHAFAGGQEEQGVALIVSLLALSVVTLLGLALTGTSMLAVMMAGNDRETTEVLYVAEAGIEHAKRLVMTNPPGDLDEILQSGNGIACDGDELTTPIAPFTGADGITSIADGGHAFDPAGRYEVVVCDDHLAESTAPSNPPTLPDSDPNHDANGRLFIRSTGFGNDGARITLELLVAGVPLPAIIADTNLRINGNPNITGPGGSVHSNYDTD